MADIRPFMSIRPEKGKAAKIAALPYDVYNRKEATEEVEKNPESFLKIDRAETGYPLSVDMYDDRVYERAHDLLWGMVEDGSFIRDQKNCYYIYELTMNGRVQTGITACASIDDYLNCVIKKHENTRAEKEADRIHHVDVCNAQTGPIFLAYRSDPVINGIVAQVKEGEPEYDFISEDGIRHRVFVIDDDEKIAAVSQAFENMADIYIADGHHRAASAVKVGLKRREEHPDYDGTEEFNYFLSVLFADEELMIMDYNRVVKDLNGLTPSEFLNQATSVYQLLETGEHCHRPEHKGQVAMYLQDKWHLLEINPEYTSADPVNGLDVALLQNLILAPVLHIADPKTDKRIDFVGGIRGMEELERRVHTDCAVAFAMYPTSIHELFEVADAGLLMPPKSTWFEPKLRSGLFIHAF